MSARTYRTTETVDFAIVGSGAAGGVLARELAQAGFDVVVLEQGPRLTAADFRHDELDYWFNNALLNSLADSPQSFRRTPDDTARPVHDVPAALYARMVGGSSNHFTANYWRFHEIDFKERSRLGSIRRARRSTTGRSTTPSSSRTTRRRNGRSAFPGSPARVRSIRRAASPTRCRHCR